MPEHTLPSATDVLIVGAGPVGLALAAELRRNGIDTVIIDKQEAGANTSRAVAVHARTLEVLETLGVTEELIRRGLKIPVFRLRDRDQLLVEIQFSDIPSAYPFVLTVPQSETEAVLLDRLRSLDGEVGRPWDAVAIDDSKAGFVSLIAAWNGTQSAIQAKYVVGCDGMHSLVRERSGIQFEGDSYQEGFFLADVAMDWPLGSSEVGLFYSPQGLMVIAPLPGGRFRIVASSENPPLNPTLADVQKILDERGPSLERGRVTEIHWASRFMIHHRLAVQMLKNRILLAGDAAHVHSPAGGQGMNTGIQDAVSLGQALSFVLAGGDEDRRKLEEWEHSRREIARRVVRFTGVLTRLSTLQSPPLQNLRNAALEFAGRITPLKETFAENLAELHNK